MLADGVASDAEGEFGQKKRLLCIICGCIKGVDAGSIARRAWFSDLEEGREGHFLAGSSLGNGSR
jgi:hypothetical protein